MCSVGDMFDVDISGEAKMCEYICRDCGRSSKELERIYAVLHAIH